MLARHQRIVDSYQQTKSIVKTAELLGFGKTTVEVVLKTQGFLPAASWVVQSKNIQANRPWRLYVLRDPRVEGDLGIRYVGVVFDRKREQGERANQERLKEHIYLAHKPRSQSRPRLPISNWIAKLLSEGCKPEMVILKEGEGEDWADTEIEAIAYYKNLGCKLMNIARGGQWNGERNTTEDTRRKLSIAATGRKHTAEWRAKMSIINRARNIQLSTDKACEMQAKTCIVRVKATLERMLKAGAVISNYTDYVAYVRKLRHFNPASESNFTQALSLVTLSTSGKYPIITPVIPCVSVEDPLALLVVDTYTKLRSLPETARHLNKLEVTTQHGRLWVNGTVKRILNKAGIETSSKEPFISDSFIAEYKALA